MAKIKCFSHNDLDGIVSNLLMCKYYSILRYGYSTETCGYGDIDDKIKGYINSYEYSDSDIIIITDVSMSYDVATLLDSLPNVKIMIDHHDTAYKELSKKNNGEKLDFDWMFIKEGHSASFHVLKYIFKICENEPTIRREFEAYKQLVFDTDLWDTGDRNSENFINERDNIDNLNELISAIGSANFKARFLTNPCITLSEIEQAGINAIKKIKKNLIKYVNVYCRTKEFKGENILYGVCFAGFYKSALAEYIFERNPELLFLIIIDLNDCTGSLRRNPKHKLVEEVDLTIIAESLENNGGGGHPFAAGFGFLMDNYKELIDRTLNGQFSLENTEYTKE